jgi:hypothetical protein
MLSFERARGGSPVSGDPRESIPMPRHLRLLLPLVCLLGGCAVVGPASLSNGRAVYNEVINYTEDQQILNVIVRERYGQTFGMLKVASVTANVKFRADTAAEFRAWGSSGDTDDLVPLSFGLAYEENPTISYVPVLGASTVRRLVLPITVEEAYLVTELAADQEIAARELYRSINGIRNPVGSAGSADWERFCDLRARLRDFGSLSVLRDEEDESMPRYMLTIAEYGPENFDDIGRFLAILGIEGKTVDGRAIRIPFFRSSGPRVPGAIVVESRSVMDWIRHAGSTIDVPPEHLEADIVQRDCWDDPAAYRFMTIRTSKKRPRSATVAVSFRDWWYYIDATDHRSKESFRLIKFLVRLRLDLDRGEQQMPVLTVPVS